VRLTKRIEHAIADGELFVEYQLVVNVDGRLVSHEALVRWRHPRRGVLSPAAFIPMIEHRPVIEALTWWVAGVVADQAVAWNRAGRCAAVSVNLSAALLATPHLVGVIARELDTHHLDPQLLTVEITESFLVTDPKRTAQTMHQLGELGVRRSIDDFGTGYTSLSMLKAYPIEEPKIDRSFTSDIVNSSVDRAIVAALVELGHRLDLAVLGEGVETEAVAAALIAIGCDRLQGFYFGRPSAPSTIGG
jgi:EAL domain-containing protein (putative c-di-GMP-specific phosphodiesterase class I)